MEQKIREQSVHSFKTKDTGWWNKNINYIKTTKEKANNKITRNTFERILNYISMLGYTFSSKAIHDDHPAKAKKYLDIYQKADPGNPDVYYLMAQWYDDKESINKAIESLKKAFRLGLDKTKNIQKDFSPAIAKHDSLSCWRNY